MFPGEVIKMRKIELSLGKNNREKIDLTGIQCGRDWNICICGGEKEHIGAVSLAMGNPVENYKLIHKPSISILTVPDHKDDIIASQVAGRIAELLNCQVCVCVGIHIENATKSELDRIQENMEKIMISFTEIVL